MDKFKLMLALEIFYKVKAFLVPFANSLCILDGDKTCMVTTERGAKVEAKMLLDMQFKKGFSKNESCYLAFLKQSPDKEVLDLTTIEAPKEIQAILADYKDVM